MAITREAGYPAETAQLADAFNTCADGHAPYAVLNASVQMVAASIGHICKSRGCSAEDAKAYTEHVCGIIGKEVANNWGRKPQPTDVAVRTA